MTDRIDALLGRLRSAPPDRDLTRLEAAVFSRINREKGNIFWGRTLEVQLAVSCGALIVGLLVAQFAGYDPMPRVLHSEMIVLSDDSVLAPSVRLEGGI